MSLIIRDRLTFLRLLFPLTKRLIFALISPHRCACVSQGKVASEGVAVYQNGWVFLCGPVLGTVQGPCLDCLVLEHDLVC